jgi:transcriptional regulator with XRE-family HTH domain
MKLISDYGLMTPLTQQAQQSMAAWVVDRLAAQGTSLECLAERASLTETYLNRALKGEIYPRLGRWFSLASILGKSVVDFISEVGLLSEGGAQYLEYCQTDAEEPLRILWEATQHLPATDRIVLLECVRYKRAEVVREPHRASVD